MTGPEPANPDNHTVADPASASRRNRPGRRCAMPGAPGALRVTTTAGCSTAVPNHGSSLGSSSGTATGAGGAGPIRPGLASAQRLASASVRPGLADPGPDTDPSADLVRARVLAAVQPGSIVNLHLGHLGTIDALPGLLQGLTARRMTCVSLTRLLTGAT